MFGVGIIRVIIVGALTALCVTAQTQQAPIKKEIAGTPDTGAITGKVVNENGQPLAGALVQARAVGATTVGQLTTADREGEFHFTNLDRAAYVVTASSPAYTPAPRDTSSTAQPTYHIGDSITFTLIKGGVVTGIVAKTNVIVEIFRDHFAVFLEPVRVVFRLQSDPGKFQRRHSL